MAWFIGQSIVIIATAFLLGILVGWLIWGRMWRSKRAPGDEVGAREIAGAREPVLAASPAATGASLAVDAEPEAMPVSGAEVAAEPVRVAAEAVAAHGVAVAVADDLERIEGIGPKMRAALLDAGIRTYEQLAGADEATLRHAIEAHGLKFAPSIVTWARQAQLLADGDEEGFADLTRRLVAGRDEGRQ